MPSIDHWMMFGTFGQQRYFVYPRADTYRGVIINANMAAHAPAGLAGFLMEKTGGLDYIIDPLTHAFQHDPSAIQNDAGELKTSFRTIADAYGAPLEDCAGKRPVLPRDLQDEIVLKKCVQRCLEFQKTRLADAMANTDAMKYLDQSSDDLAPNALVAPYFFMTETTLKRWLPICSRAAALGVESAPNARVFSAVVVSQGVVASSEARDQIAAEFEDIDVAGFLLWVDDLDEQTAGMDELKGLVDLARGLRGKKEREVINLHGGYFSVLAAGVLGDSAMSGVTHAPEFGEYRSVVPVGGGIPIARYYIPHLHARVRYRDALRLLNAKGWLDDAADFHRNVCDCQECVSTIEGNIGNFKSFGVGNVKPIRRGSGIIRIEYPTEETKKRCLRHYLQRKAIEYQFSATASAQQIREDLHRGVSEFEEVAGLEQVAHLDLWDDVLSSHTT